MKEVKGHGGWVRFRLSVSPWPDSERAPSHCRQTQLLTPAVLNLVQLGSDHSRPKCPLSATSEPFAVEPPPGPPLESERVIKF